MTVELTLLSGAGWRGEKITGARLHGLLALLADDLRAGCSSGRLIEALWPDDELPEHPAKALQTLVSRARARLGAEVIRSTPTGYRLALDPEQVDSSVVLSCRREAERSTRAGDHAAAIAAAEDGLALFGDGPLSEARAGTRAALTRIRALGLARSGGTIEPLARLAAECPRDEEILLELLRAEAPAAALARYDTYRRALRDELGADPGPELRAMHRELLLNDAPLVRQGLRHEPNELLGRDADIDRVAGLLRTRRVVSVVGAGGLGKTRLAQAVGRQARQRLVYFVELAGISGDAVGEVAGALGVTDVNGIVEVLGAGPALLILDNCEHVIHSVAELVGDLVSRTAQLRVLTTSRAPLGLSSESVYPLPELDLATMVELFVQRARAVRPNAEMSDIEALCCALDGLPLAAELAAARIRVMSPREIAQRLDDRFALLRGGNRDTPERHRTLHAVIDWSWHLLDPPARSAMGALSIFPGGFDAHAASYFTDDATVEQLVDQSLLKVADTPAGTRFRMLETVREFSIARREDDPRILERFLTWAKDRGTQPEDYLIGSVETIRADEDNLALALRHGLDREDAATVAATASLLGTLWLTDSKLTRLIALSAEAPTILARFHPPQDLVEATRTAAVWCALIAFLVRGPDPLHALATLRHLPPPDPATVIGAAQLALTAPDEKALKDLCDSDRPLLAGIACYGHSYLAEYSNDPVAALRSARRMLPLLGDIPWLRALAHARIGELCLQADPGEEAYRHIDAALSIMEELGAQSSAARARWALVLANLQRGAFDQAEQGLEQLARTVLIEDAGPKMVGLCTRAEIRLGRGDIDGGLALWREAADGLSRDDDLWSAEVRAVTVIAHCRHGRLAQVTDLADALPATVAGLLPDAPAAVFRICGVLLVALAAVASEHGAKAPAGRILALADRFGFSSTFGDPARFATSARASDRPAYAAAQAEFASLDHAALRAAALTLIAGRALPEAAAVSSRRPGPDGFDNVARVLEARFGVVREIEPYHTWGRTIVVAALVGDDRRPVVLKATAERDVLAEAATLRLVHEAGVPAPRLVEAGEDPALPGGQWIVMERAGGSRLADVAEHDLDPALRSLAASLSRLHGISRAGYGWLNRAGAGRFDSWSNWLRHVLSLDLGMLRTHGAIRSEVAGALEACFARNASELDRRPARLLHGDLGDTEIFVDENLEVTAIVDWADAVVGDPLYDFARFVAGGPAADPRPARMRPEVMRLYAHPLVDGDRYYALYQAHNAIRNAAWSAVHAPEWVNDLVDFAAAEASKLSGR
jgi:predicted ATPase/aminoglycoside phosphotransferase (APT) family kinase protein/DNA-binding SARP family transcriptional activator